MRVKINLTKSDSLDLSQLTSLLKEHKITVSFINSNDVENDFLYEIEDNGFIIKGKSQQTLFEALNTKSKTILKD